MNEEEIKNLVANVTEEIVADATALAGKYNMYRVLIAEKIVALAVTKKKYNSLFNDYLKPFCTDRLDVFFCIFCLHYEIYYKQVAEIYGSDHCIKMLDGKETPEGELHDDIKIV